MAREYSAVLAGIPGSGKTSIFNLLARKDIAKVSHSAAPCTGSTQKVRLPCGDDLFVEVYDTAGLGDGLIETRHMAAERFRKSLYEISQDDGIHVLIFVVKKGDDLKSSFAIFRRYYVDMCRSKVPIVLVVTHVDSDTDWDQCNKDYKFHFSQESLFVQDCIPVCSAQVDTFPENIQDEITRLRELTRERIMICVGRNMQWPGLKVYPSLWERVFKRPFFGY
ncbi:uncharacterized protein LOC110861599 [Folsomia candida]|uniref:uncharacterized protein LOC110861599 n=1 Tax=Folsomia candida TaxID=158441 RepID=UPI000B902092|nr:uncharacterized protein LOC110861599 [Folsomia candida]